MPAGVLPKLSTEAALSDLQLRTLTALGDDVSKLIYLASTRDYNTGRYCHDGLARHFGRQTAEAALAAAHKDVFRSLLLSSLPCLVEQLDRYIQSTRQPFAEIVGTWEKLHPYRVIVPTETDALSMELLFSNFRLALKILQAQRSV